MKIVVFGAAGVIGRRLIDQLLSQHHQVVAYDRNIDQWLDKSLEQDHIFVIKGYLLDRKEVEKAIRGTDAVFFLVSGEKEAGDISRSGGIKHVLNGMLTNRIRRIIVLGDAILLDNESGHPVCEQDDFPPERSAYASELLKMWQQLRDSEIDWTLVCPVEVTDLPESSAYISFNSFSLAEDRQSISAGDLVRFMVREMTEKKYIRERIGIAGS
jgi:putative NADH-flavin reductase